MVPDLFERERQLDRGMLGAMQRPLNVLCVFVIGCTSSAPSQEAMKADAAKQAAAAAKQEAEKAKVDAIQAAQDAAKAEEEAAKKKAMEAAAAQAEAAKLEAQLAMSGERPVYVMLGGSGSRTSKPVTNAVLAKSWGWDSASAADIAACEAKATSPGQLMWCSTEDKPKGAAELIAKLQLEGGKSVFVTPEQIASWNVPAPTGPVWLFGPKQACKATVGRPLVGWYSVDPEFGEDDEGDEDESDEDEGEDEKPEGPDLSEPFTVVELAWELTGCEMAGAKWAPIGVAAAELDPNTRWVPMKAGERQRFDPATWTGAVASEVVKLPGVAKPDEDAPPVSGDPEWWAQTFELRGTEVRELYFGAAWGKPVDASTPDLYDCSSAEFSEVFQVRMGASGATMIGRGSRGKLVGALAAGADVHSMVWTDSLDYQVAKLEPTGLGASIDLSTGVSFPEDGGERHYTLLDDCGM
jgi:hypothetical protein